MRVEVLFGIVLLAASVVTQPVGLEQVAGTLANVTHVRPHLIYYPYSLTSPGVPPYTPFEIRKAYNFAPLYPRGVNGSGTRIAIIDAFGSSTLSADLASFDSHTGLPPATVNFYFPDGVPKFRNSNWAGETTLDVEWAHAIAPGATIDLVVAVDSSLGHIFDAIAFVANSLPSEIVLSMSFGASESSFPTTGSFTIAMTHQLFVTMTAHGTTPVASSGDSGATSCCNPQYPSSDPLVVAVGGTSLFLNSDASYSSETTWSGSTAGASTVFPKPSWQQGLGDAMRDTVDVSYDADLNTGVLMVFGGALFTVGGTSVGAPQWAGLLALASQADSAKFGAVDSLLYRASSYHDITTGSNGFFSATVGWDYPTGLGSPDANATVRALATGTVIPATISSTMALQSVTVASNGTLAVSTGSLTLSGLVTVRATDTVTGTLLFAKTYTVPSLVLQNRGSSFQSSFLLNVAVSPYPLSVDVTVSLSTGSVSVSLVLTRQVDIDGNGIVDFADVSVVAFAFGSSVGSPSYNPRADLNADGTILLDDFSLVGFYYNAPNFL